MIDTKKRSLWKAITWRLFAIVLLGIVSYATTEDVKTASMITGNHKATNTLLRRCVFDY